MNSYIYLIIIIFLCSVPRFYLLLKYQWVGKDTFYHFIVANAIKNKGFPPVTIDQFIEPEKYDYPPLLHLFLSLFDEKYYQKIQYISPLSDIVAGFVIFLFCNQYFNVQIALLSTTIYMLTPFVFDNAYSLSPRPIANLFLMLALFSIFNFYMSHNCLWFIFSIICSSIILLSHRLTTQCLIIILMSLSIGIKSPFPLYVIFISLIITIIITKGYYIQVIKGHFAFVYELGKKVSNKKYVHERQKIFPDIKYVIFNLPIILFTPLLLLCKINLSDPSLAFPLIWTLSLIILSIFWIFGEGIRHMICAVPAISIIFSYCLVENNQYNLFAMIIFISVFFLLYKIYKMEKNPSNSGIITKEMKIAFNFINKNKEKGDIILSVPLDYTYNIAYFTNCIVLQSSGGFAKGLSFNQHLNYKINNGKLNEIIDTYHPNWILYFKDSKLLDINYLANPKLMAIKEIGNIQIYSIKF